MKMVICFDTEDPKGMQNTIKMIDHLAMEYANRRVALQNEQMFNKIEVIKMLRAFAGEIAEAQGLNDRLLREVTDDETPSQYRTKEDWEGLRFAKQFADRMFEIKRAGKRIHSASGI
tara:strand:+ start:1792 stop:2142 length:351 start_codon:yes stop_codon:yes gene_type:complete